MKLRLRCEPFEVFDAPRGIGLALIELGAAMAYTEPAPVIDPEVAWSIVGAADRQLYLKAECPICHQGATLATVTPFKHCGTKLANPPADLAERLRAHLVQRKEAAQKTPSHSPSEMHWI